MYRAKHDSREMLVAIKLVKEYMKDELKLDLRKINYLMIRRYAKELLQQYPDVCK